LIKIIIKEENFKWHLEAFASELFICFTYVWVWTNAFANECNDLLQNALLLSENAKPFKINIIYPPISYIFPILFPFRGSIFQWDIFHMIS